MEALEVGRRVEALELRRFESLEPGDVEVRHDVVGDVVAGIERARDRVQRRLAVSAADRLKQPVVTRDGRIAAARRGDGDLSGRSLHVWHVTRDREQDL